MILVEKDEDGLISLAAVARYDKYLVHAEPDGTIILTPLPDSDPTE